MPRRLCAGGTFVQRWIKMRLWSHVWHVTELVQDELMGMNEKMPKKNENVDGKRYQKN